jgi:hypothetical protein
MWFGCVISCSLFEIDLETRRFYTRANPKPWQKEPSMRAESSRPREGLPRRALPLWVASLGLLSIDAGAENNLGLGLQTETHFSNLLRRDGTLSRPRSVTQSVMLHKIGKPASDSHRTTDLRVGFRYFNDFGLAYRLRGEPSSRFRFSQASLDVASIRWSPIASIYLIAGRQWILTPNRLHGIDGLRLGVESPMSGGGTAYVEAFAGRHLRGRSAAWEPEIVNQNGVFSALEADDKFDDLALGASLGLRWDDVEFDGRYQRRQDLGSVSGTGVDDETIGLQIKGPVARLARLQTHAVYHTLSSSVDEAGFRVSADGPGKSEVSLGARERRPRFDSASIFNLFGNSPHQDVEIEFAGSLDAFNTELLLRGWSRFYRGYDRQSFFDDRIGDDRLVGFALRNRTRWTHGSGEATLNGQLGLLAHTQSPGRQARVGCDAALPIVPRINGHLGVHWVGATADDIRRGDSQTWFASLGVNLDSDLGLVTLKTTLEEGDTLPMRSAFLATFQAWRWM